MPIKEGQWQLVGDFATPLTISKFYQLAGGVDLTQSVPSPFNALTGFGVTNMQLLFNSKDTVID